ncbi:MAG TPA: GNAT family N-acetyltransferase [Candidatus Scatovivens faecipullorum]|nr:GNAT family N-acetyltransferase [Candidatus Scatovivens faecipullorum]
MIEIKEVDIKEAIKVHKNIKEFNETKPEKEYFENRYRDREKLIIVAYYNNVPAGYIIGYDKFQDGKNFYCWMAGVDSKFRKLGILTKMMQYQENWAKQKGYSILKIKTRNNRREMLSFLVKHNFNFLSVEKRDNIQDNRINLQKEI